MATRTVKFFGVEAKRMKPTKKHRRALWESMLGTVMAQNTKGKIKYFDYKWEDAIAFAEIAEATDIRVARWEHGSGYDCRGPRKGQLVLSVIR